MHRIEIFLLLVLAEIKSVWYNIYCAKVERGYMKKATSLLF